MFYHGASYPACACFLISCNLYPCLGSFLISNINKWLLTLYFLFSTSDLDLFSYNVDSTLHKHLTFTLVSEVIEMYINGYISSYFLQIIHSLKILSIYTFYYTVLLSQHILIANCKIYFFAYSYSGLQDFEHILLLNRTEGQNDPNSSNRPPASTSDLNHCPSKA